MKKSDSIKELATALSKAQGEISHAGFDKTNPHFRSKYASIASILHAIQEPLTKYGLSVIQGIHLNEVNEQFVSTMIIHSSGEWIEDDGVKLLNDKGNMQGLGSAYTYARRYGLQAMLRVAVEDDDGNAATENPISEVKKNESLEAIRRGAPITKPETDDFIRTPDHYGEKYSDFSPEQLKKMLSTLYTKVKADGRDPTPAEKEFSKKIRAIQEKASAMAEHGITQ